jgi:dTDP-4-dehydrorhamnose reductase
MSTKILLLGSKGIIGSEISRNISNIYEVRSYGHKDLDITNFNLIEKIIKEFNPAIIINSAAYTQVDKAENDTSLCYEVNSYSVKNLSELCNSYKIQLIHISTDYIFDGTKESPYNESDSGEPVNIYGDSKNRADEYIKSSGCNYIILRTSWVYGHEGNNFVKSILQRSLSNDKLEIVCDQYGTPTSSYLIGIIIKNHIIKYCIEKKDDTCKEIFNLCPTGYTSWFNFAKYIIKHASNINSAHKVDLVSIKSEDYTTVAKRPRYTALSNHKICTFFDINIQNWEYYLEYFLDNFIDKKV